MYLKNVTFFVEKITEINKVDLGRRQLTIDRWVDKHRPTSTLTVLLYGIS